MGSLCDGCDTCCAAEFPHEASTKVIYNRHSLLELPMLECEECGSGVEELEKVQNSEMRGIDSRSSELVIVND